MGWTDIEAYTPVRVLCAWKTETDERTMFTVTDETPPKSGRAVWVVRKLGKKTAECSSRNKAWAQVAIQLQEVHGRREPGAPPPDAPPQQAL